MLKPCKIKDLHTPTLNTPEHVPSPRAATAFTKAPPALHSTTPHHFLHHSLHHFHHTTSTTQPPPNSIPTPYLLSPHSLSSPLYPHLPLPLPYLPPHTTIPYLPTYSHFQQSFLPPPFPTPLPPSHSHSPTLIPYLHLTTPSLLPTYSLSSPLYPHLPLPPFPPPLPPHTVNKHIIYW